MYSNATMSFCVDGCYCCGRISVKDKMDVDAALHELGMLSAVTNSRKEYMHERKRTQIEPVKGSFKEPIQGSSSVGARGYQILHCDPKYVTAFSAEMPCPAASTTTAYTGQTETPRIPQTTQTDAILDPNIRDKECHPTLLAERRRKTVPRRSLLRKNRYKRYLKPYEVPWRHNTSLPEAEMRKEDNYESKSSDSSPVKALSDGLLTRSRSLNNLEAARTKLADIFEETNFLGGLEATERQLEIDGVSERIKNFHFMEKRQEIDGVSRGIADIHFSPEKSQDDGGISSRIASLHFTNNS